MRKIFIFTFLFINIIIIIAGVLFINNGLSEGIKGASKVRVDFLFNPFNINLEGEDKILNISLSSFEKLGEYIKDVLLNNIINRIQDTFIYTNVY